MPTEDEIRAAERKFQRAAKRADEVRLERDRVIREALAEGWTHARIAEAAGHPRGWVSKFA